MDMASIKVAETGPMDIQIGIGHLGAKFWLIKEMVRATGKWIVEASGDSKDYCEGFRDCLKMTTGYKGATFQVVDAKEIIERARASALG